MQYLNKTFTMATTTKRMTQREYEIAVGLRNPDGTLVQPKIKAHCMGMAFPERQKAGGK